MHTQNMGSFSSNLYAGKVFENDLHMGEKVLWKYIVTFIIGINAMKPLINFLYCTLFISEKPKLNSMSLKIIYSLEKKKRAISICPLEAGRATSLPEKVPKGR